jgi:hypothetical protein
MLKKSFENIDNRASIPKEITFRKELYWDKIQKIPAKKTHPYWVWIAASFTLLVGFGFWVLQGSIEFTPQYIISQVSQDSQMNVALREIPKPIAKKIYFGETRVLQLPEPLALKKADNLEENENFGQKSTNTQRLILMPSFNIEEEEEKQVQEEKQLSPSANALKKALANTKKEVPKEEKMVVEKLTFEQMIQARRNYFIEKNQYKKTKKEDE